LSVCWGITEISLLHENQGRTRRRTERPFDANKIFCIFHSISKTTKLHATSENNNTRSPVVNEMRSLLSEEKEASENEIENCLFLSLLHSTSFYFVSHFFVFLLSVIKDVFCSHLKFFEGKMKFKKGNNSKVTKNGRRDDEFGHHEKGNQRFLKEIRIK
jgi:hypothetical protein